MKEIKSGRDCLLTFIWTFVAVYAGAWVCKSVYLFLVSVNSDYDRLRRCDSRFTDRRLIPISARYRLLATFHTTLPFGHPTLLRHWKQCSLSACLSIAFSVFTQLLSLLLNVFEMKFKGLLTFEYQDMFILSYVITFFFFFLEMRRVIEIFPSSSICRN